jgi:hypothetical protein
MGLLKNRNNSVRMGLTLLFFQYLCVGTQNFHNDQNTKKRTERKSYPVARFDSGYRESCVIGHTVVRCLLLYEILRFPKLGNLPLTLCSFIDTITVSDFLILYIPLNKVVCEDQKINRLARFWYGVILVHRVTDTTLDLTKCMGRFRIRNIRNGSRYMRSIYVSPLFDAPIRHRLQEVHHLHCVRLAWIASFWAQLA